MIPMIGVYILPLLDLFLLYCDSNHTKYLFLLSDLFHRVILMSGSGNCLWSVQPHPLEVAEQLAEDLDCPAPPGSGFLECVREKPYEDLIQAQTDRQVSCTTGNIKDKGVLSAILLCLRNFYLSFAASSATCTGRSPTAR